MAELKTNETKASVATFLAGVEDAGKRADCRRIAKLMRNATGKRAKMWGDSIVGYGRYDYTYQSGHSGSWMLTGFSPRARNITIYIMPGFKKFQPLLKKLGKFKTAKSCLYIKRLDDIDEAVLSRLVADSVREMQRIYGAS